MKSGIVALVGRSNVGKSTLLNSLIGKKLAATSLRPQTTRHLIHGVLNHKEGQAVFVDTPGVFELSRDVLSRKLMKIVEEALVGIDLLAYVVDPTRPPGEEEKRVQALLSKSKIPKIFVINKIDLPLPYKKEYESFGEDFEEIIELSALKGKHTKKLAERIFSYLPESDPLYPEGQLTNIDEKFWISEIIRERVFQYLGEELPYRIMVEVEDIIDEKKLLRIRANVVTSEPHHKGMIIGRYGSMLKKIGSSAREELELLIGRKIFLELYVSVDKNWQMRF